MDELSQALVKGGIEGLKEIAKEIFGAGAKYSKEKIAKLSVDFEYGFRDYLDRNLQRLAKVKTLLNPHVPVAVEEAYVSPNLKVKNKSFDEDQFLQFLSEKRFCVITGIGGSGKSIFLKHLFIRFYSEELGRVPIFVELRQLKSGTSLIDHMASQLQAVAPAINSELFRYALKAGKFLLLIDGFDEVDPSDRDSIAKQIVEFSYEYGANNILLTSRPDGPFNSWNEFYVAEMEGFNKKQVISLVGKMEYNSDTKVKFLDLINKNLFRTHRNYLSNPLLCTLLLLTFDQGAEIPSKMHIFFERAYEVLFYQHDATKETSFRRKFKSDLAADDFRSAFASFSSFCYLDHGSAFTRVQGLGSARQAMNYDAFKGSPEDFLEDLCTSVSILIREGDNYNYIHRSFQEYFVADFLAKREIDRWSDVIQHIVVTRPNDSVPKLLLDLNRDRFERLFLAPRIEQIRTKLETIDIGRNPVAAFLLFFITFSFRQGRLSSWTVGIGDNRPLWHYMVSFLDQSPELQSVSRKLDEFDWTSHAGALKITVKDGDADSKQFSDISNKCLIGSPMIDYLEEIKRTIILMDNRLKANVENQRSLVSSTFFKKSNIEELS